MKGIADLLDSDMEESANSIDENSILSSVSDATTTKDTQAKKGRKRHRVTMPAKSKSKTTVSQSKKAISKQTVPAKRKAADEEVNSRDLRLGNDAQWSETEQQTSEPKPMKRVRGPSKTKPVKQANVIRTQDVAEEDVMDMEQPATEAARPMQASSGDNSEPVKARKKAAPARKPKVVQELQTLVSEIRKETTEEEEENTEPLLTEKVSKSNVAPRNVSRPRPEPTYRRRAGSASDTERADPSLRRKLGDVTRKFENVDLKYRNLKEVGIHEANTNMEKLRRQCDATMQASNDLIASLKKELAAQAPLVQEARRLKKQMQSQEVEVSRMRDVVTELESSLTTAQNEIKGLQAKLAAARAPSVDTAASKPPGSAIKGKSQRPVVMGSAEAAQAAQCAQMKEDLYSDLTGLIIRSVKKTDEGDTYDCIQTGRNGTLHFKLFVDQEDARNASFEETEFLYTPLLDANRDRDMIEHMPSYLIEDITFARQNAAKFYGRVVDTLTKKRAEE
ncbi:hypothetical protein PV05_04614 [Exophiala xenobiotica]|uniref:Monopolin complex subunit Csm1/Pcs1 C-terminal domain-containing protein n=1 Tax=Exophiala xenobiotica TaxID=348802 RepID=A0A0D2BTV8_9EURO|nr:uncharacterized protein PV05_04614 [Exophiala xenobiotica]KIW55906.1 hypothetical protein PV05_04614 [Exophiala xenobiotica]